MNVSKKIADNKYVPQPSGFSGFFEDVGNSIVQAFDPSQTDSDIAEAVRDSLKD